MSKLLIANRGEIAIRIARAAEALGITTVAVFARDDAESLHARRATEARPLGGEGAAAYLDIAQLVAIGKETGCTAVHPGYGFLSENAAFARACAAAGITFIGPSAELLELFGDKTAARALARERGVSIVPGTGGPTTLEQAKAFAAEHGAVMIKALAGGGGRGMREVLDPAGIEGAFAVCAREAEQAFGNGDLFVEKLVRHARHLEVQIVGDGSGKVIDLGERDCTVQMHHQKLIEMAPSPALSDARRAELLRAARELAAHVKYSGLGTFEFLVSDDGFWFIEANPRLQVEHTVTEEVNDVDLVRAQIRIGLGASLAEVGLAESTRVHGFAVQARVNLQTITAEGQTRPAAGTLTAFTPPSGPGVRVDTYGYRGYRTSLRYDSLLAKVIVRDTDFAAAIAATDRALAEFELEGVASNIGLLRAVLRHPRFVDGAKVDTSFVDEHARELVPAAAAKSPRHDDFAVPAPMQAVVSRVLVREGEQVSAGAPLVQLEAMKMEHVIRAEHAGTVRRVLVRDGDMVDEDAPLLHLEPRGAPAAGLEAGKAAAPKRDDWSPEVAEIERRLKMAETLGGADKVVRQRESGRRTVARAHHRARRSWQLRRDRPPLRLRRVRSRRRADSRHAHQLPLRHRAHRHAARRPRRRRLHRSRRLGRRRHLGEADPLREARRRDARAHRAPARRRQRRRQREDDRHRRLHLRPAQSGMGRGGGEPVDRAGGGRLPRPDRRSRRGTPRHEPLRRHGRRHRPALHRRSAGGARGHGRGPDQGGSRRRQRAPAQWQTSSAWSRARTKPSTSFAASSPTCLRACSVCRRSFLRRIRPTAATTRSSPPSRAACARCTPSIPSSTASSTRAPSSATPSTAAAA